MDARFDLVRRAQSGDDTAAQALIERNQAIIFRLALVLLEDPEEASQATVETFHNALNQLDEYSGKVAFSTWLYPFAVEVCQRRLKQRAFMRRLRKLFGRGDSLPDEKPVPAMLSTRQARLAQAANRLEGWLRLPLVLRYDQALTVQELAPMLGLRENVAQARLVEARRRMRVALGEPILTPPAEEPGNDLSHHQARKLLEAAADHLISDADDGHLRRHLKHCDDCQAVAHRLETLEEQLSESFHRSWDGHSLPPGAIGSAKPFIHHSRQNRPRLLNWLGAVLVALMTIGVIFLLPDLAPAAIVKLPPTPTSSPPAIARMSGQRGALAQRAAPDWPVIPPLKDTPGLMAKIPAGRLAFINLGTNDQLETMNSDGSDVQALIGGVFQSSSPAWSPDGTQIAFLSMLSMAGPNQVYVINADGSQAHQVSNDHFPANLSPSQGRQGYQMLHYPLYGPPEWSPDGRWIAATVWADPSTAYLALLPAQEGEARYLPVNGIDRWMMAWSPDGQTLAYMTQAGDGLWLWKPDQPLQTGENPRKISQQVTWNFALGLAWSPDSGKIAIMVGNYDQGYFDVSLHIFGADGKLALEVPLVSALNGRFLPRISDLTWSPDGRYLAFMPLFTQRERFSQRIMLIQPEGDNLETLVEVAQPINGYSWSPDGRWIGFAAGQEVWMASLNAYENDEDYLVKVTTSTGYGLSWQPGGK